MTQSVTLTRLLAGLGGMLALSCGNGGGSGDTSGGTTEGTGGSATGGEAGGSAGNMSSGGTSGASTGGSGGTLVQSGTCPGGVTPLAGARVPAGYCAWLWATDLSAPRGVTVDEAGDALLVDRGSGQVVALWDDDGDGVSGASERAELASAAGLNHAITVHDGYLYASSSNNVYRWAYAAGSRASLGASETVINAIPPAGHSTRTLAFDAAGNLYVSIGSENNVDPDSSRARVVRFSPTQVNGGTSFVQGEVFADGLRNEVGLRFDSQGRLWGVENGVDNVSRADLGGDIHDDNPGEEVNLFAEPGRFYGYPYCFSEFLLPAGVGEGPGAQWAHPDFIDDGVHTDAWCKDETNVVPPVLSLQAHSAPLDILFYQGSALPAGVVGDAFVTFHGSWNRSPATGYKVVRLPFSAAGNPSGEVVPLLEYAGSGDTAGDWPHRPVGLAVLTNGVLLVTSDASNVVIAVGHEGG